MKAVEQNSADCNGSGCETVQHDADFDQQLAAALDVATSRALALFPAARTITIALEIDRPGPPQPAVSPFRAGGLKRARTAIRAPDGKFLGAALIAEMLEDEREKKVSAGRTRARRARRALDGTFLPA